MSEADGVAQIRLAELPEAVQTAVAHTRERVAALHAELPRNELVVWTAGNVSERVPEVEPPAGEPAVPGLFAIKPSGVSYDELTPESMVVCTLDGEKIDDGTPASLQPSSDTAAHAYVYRHMADVGGVVHTHSAYATAWAARGEPIPCVLTMMADEFGGEIPVGPFALIGDDSIGRGIVETLRTSRSKAVLMDRHGPFTVGGDAKAAVKAAVLCEETARTVHIAYQHGTPQRIEQHLVDSLYERYQNVYGQRGGAEEPAREGAE